MLLEMHRTELELLTHKNFPVDNLRRELGLTKPSLETILDLRADGGGELAQVAVLSVGIREHEGFVLRLRYRTDVLDEACAARIAGYHLAALALMAADPDAEHERQSLLSAEELDLSSGGWPARAGNCRTAGFTSCSRSGFAHTRTPSQLCTATRSGATGSSMAVPISWRELCWREGCRVKAWSRW